MEAKKPTDRGFNQSHWLAVYTWIDLRYEADRRLDIKRRLSPLYLTVNAKLSRAVWSVALDYVEVAIGVFEVRRQVFSVPKGMRMSLIARLFSPSSATCPPVEMMAEVATGETDFSTWFVGKEFSADWTSGHFPTWSSILAPMKGLAPKLLEIGSYEGFSALFFLNFFPGSSIVCIDPWDTSSQEPTLAELVPGATRQYPLAEGRFDRNLAGC